MTQRGVPIATRHYRAVEPAENTRRPATRAHEEVIYDF
jgi:hypothetical protein